MKNDIKGFTLIELLAVIIILAIVTLISMPIMTNVINNFKIRAYIQNEQSVIKATELYLHKNTQFLPSEIGDTTEISLYQLQSSNYIKKIKDPNNSSVECNGYVIVTKLEKNNYNYTPHIKCGEANNISSSTKDGLIAHYKFDDFQESTRNIIPNSPKNTYPTIGNQHGTYNTNQYNSNIYFSIGTIGSITNNIVNLSSVDREIYTYDVLTPQTTGGGVVAGTRYFIKKHSNNSFSLHEYNSTPDGSIGFAVHDSIKNDIRININATDFPTMWHGPAHLPNSALVKEIIPNCYNNHECVRMYTDHKPEGKVDGMAYGVLPPVEAGKTYTFSFYYRAASEKSLGKNITLDLHVAGWSSSKKYKKIDSMEWQRYERTDTMPNSGGSNLYFWVDKGANVDITEIQCEEKPYATPYTSSIREAIVKDYSGNGNHAKLNLTNTPRWTKESQNGSGSYLFDTNSKINLPLEMNNNNFGKSDAQYTFSMWINLDKHNISGIGVIFGMAYYNGFGIYLNSDGSTFTKIGSYFRNKNDQYVTNLTSLELNKWYFVTSVLDKPNSKIKFYLNGELFAEKSITVDEFTYENRVFAINNQNQPGGNGPWANMSGYIDDVRIYNRALTNDEIKLIYYTNKK